MSGCIGCLPSPGEQDAELQTKLKEAKAFAVAQGKNAFLYKDETGHWEYMAEDVAREIGIQPMGGIVSFLEPTSQ